MGLLDDIYAQAQARSSKSDTFIPPLMNNESYGSDVTSQILNADNAAQVNQRISGQGSSNTGIPWYFDNRNLRPDRLFIINPDPSTLNTPQASNAGSSSPNMRDTSQLNFTANNLVNMRFDKSIPKQDYKVANPYQFNPSDLQNYDPQASPLDYYNTSEFDNYNAYNFANNIQDMGQQSNSASTGRLKWKPYNQKYEHKDGLNLSDIKLSDIPGVTPDKIPARICRQNEINKEIARELYNDFKSFLNNTALNAMGAMSHNVAKQGLRQLNIYNRFAGKPQVKEVTQAEYNKIDNEIRRTNKMHSISDMYKHAIYQAEDDSKAYSDIAKEGGSGLPSQVSGKLVATSVDPHKWIEMPASGIDGAIEAKENGDSQSWGFAKGVGKAAAPLAVGKLAGKYDPIVRATAVGTAQAGKAGLEGEDASGVTASGIDGFISEIIKSAKFKKK